MNYDHHYHAGNFSDVMKHLVMIAIIDQLQSKDKPLYILDTHAGCGQYDLEDDRALRTHEAQFGVQSLWHQCDALVHPLLKKYCSILNSFNYSGKTLKFYPGSPQIIQSLMNEGTRLSLCEKKPTAYEQLSFYLKYQPAVQVYCEDGYAGLKRMLPPPERRGFVLIDPPYEVTNEFDLIEKALMMSLKKFASGTYMIWYPIKYVDRIQQFFKNVMLLPAKNIFVAELFLADSSLVDQLKGSGVIIINLPYGIAQSIDSALDECTQLISNTKQFKARTFWLKEGK